MKLIDGKVIANSLYEEVAAGVSRLPFKPIFCDVLIGEDPASVQYVRMKEKTAQRLGFEFLHAQFPSTASEHSIIGRIESICRTSFVCGVIVQLPIPTRINKVAVVHALASEVDVDCLTPGNVELFYADKLPFMPPTPAAILAALDSVLAPQVHSQLKFAVVGQGELVGRPVAHLLKARGVQVDVITRATQHPERVASQADVLITGVGQPHLIGADWVKEGAIVIDAGTAESEGSVVGDVDAHSISSKASFLSPTPGGVGPITVARLFWNVLQVAEAKQIVLRAQ